MNMNKIHAVNEPTLEERLRRSRIWWLPVHIYVYGAAFYIMTEIWEKIPK